MKNIETPDKMHLGKLIEQLRGGEYVIPDFQREFEWLPWNVVELLKSIFDDCYIGTLLLWRSSHENQDLLKCEPIYGFEGKASPEHIILDGQQRLSALYYSFFAPKKPYPRRKSRCFFLVNIRELLADNFGESIYYEWGNRRTMDLINNKTRQFEEKIFPLCVFGQGSHAWIRWMEEYQNYWTKKIGAEDAKIEREKIDKFFDEMINQYDISYIELDRDIEVGKVCDIFTRLNSTGMELTIFDLMNAMLRPKNIYLKKMWRAVSVDFNVADEEKMRLYLLQTMSILKQGYCAPKYLYYLVPESQKIIKLDDGSKKKITLIKTPEEFIELWDFVVEKVKGTIRELQNPRDFGAINAKFLPYPTMIPIFTAINVDKEKYPERKGVESKIKKWYWSSIFTKNYSSAVESQATKDFYDMQKWFANDNNYPSVIEQCNNEINYLDLKSEDNQSSAIYKAIFDILILKGAKDWNTFMLPEYSKLADHHIVPYSWGRKNIGREINSILNRTPLADETNRKIIRDHLPNVYLKEMLSKAKKKEDIYKLLETHLISRKGIEILLRKDFSRKDYEEFIEERQKTILKEIKNILEIGDELGQMPLMSPETPFSNRLQMERIIKSCNNYLFWVDKYFSLEGLKFLSQFLDSNEVREIKILTSIEKIDENFRGLFKSFKSEMKNKKVDCKLRIMDRKTGSQIHDRWIISQDRCFNSPSPDVVARGQYSEFKETKNKPPFEEWWQKSKDIITEWNTIKNFIQ
jgi:hypothetical protein